MSSTLRSRALYRNLLREGKQFPDYELRPYIQRRTRDDFRVHFATLKDADKQLAFGEAQLALIKRQAAIRNLYVAPKSVVELSSTAGAKKIRQ